jgi:hypothetical protein
MQLNRCPEARWPSQACVRPAIAFSLLFVASWSGRAAGAEPATEPAAPVEYSILTPALESKYFVCSGAAQLLMLPDFVNDSRSMDLRAAVKQSQFRATDHFALELQAALREAGHTAEIEFVPRAADGKKAALGRADLPKHPKGRFLIDVTLRSIGINAPRSGGEWEPFVFLSWRLYTTDGDIVGFPHDFPAQTNNRRERDRPRSPSVPVFDLPSFGKMMNDPMPLWACFDKTFHRTSVTRVPAIRAATPGS